MRIGRVDGVAHAAELVRVLAFARRRGGAQSSGRLCWHYAAAAKAAWMTTGREALALPVSLKQSFAWGVRRLRRMAAPMIDLRETDRVVL